MRLRSREHKMALKELAANREFLRDVSSYYYTKHVGILKEILGPVCKSGEWKVRNKSGLIKFNAFLRQLIGSCTG